MNSAAQIPGRRGRVFRWLMMGAGLCLAPFVVLAFVVASYLSLDGDATVLRREVMAATETRWNTTIQVSLGRATINAVNFGLGFIRDNAVAEVRAALTAVRRASVGVYERVAGDTSATREKLFRNTDQAMQKRGWSRLVGAVDGKDAILIYVPQNMAVGGVVEICLAIISGKELVVASTQVDAISLAELVKHPAFANMKSRLRLIRCSL